MKTKFWVLTTLALFIVAIGYATDFPKMSVVKVEADKALVAYSSKEKTPLEITLTNWKAEIIYFKRTENRCSEFKKIFDFSQLGDGDYEISVNYGNRSVGRKLSIDKEQIEVGPSQQLYEPYFSIKENRLTVSFLNCPEKKVYLNIYQNGKHVNSVTLGKDLAIQKSFDLSNLEKGEYEIVLSDYFKDHKYIVQL